MHAVQVSEEAYCATCAIQAVDPCMHQNCGSSHDCRGNSHLILYSCILPGASHLDIALQTPKVSHVECNSLLVIAFHGSCAS